MGRANSASIIFMISSTFRLSAFFTSLMYRIINVFREPSARIANFATRCHSSKYPLISFQNLRLRRNSSYASVGNFGGSDIVPLIGANRTFHGIEAGRLPRFGLLCFHGSSCSKSETMGGSLPVLRRRSACCWGPRAESSAGFGTWL